MIKNYIITIIRLILPPKNLHYPAGVFAIIHRGKPPAIPGDSPGFDLYDGRCEFLISTKRKEIHDERISEPEPYEVGL